jgi:3-isopropylmalate dehydrogenase
MYVDSAAMALVSRPTQFDVILTENMFGDILSDQAGAVVGSLGLLPSASVGGKVGLYEPIHGSAPDIAGQGIANPLGAILSAAMLLRHSFKLENEAASIEIAVREILAEGHRTRDLAGKGERSITTRSRPCLMGNFSPLDLRCFASLLESCSLHTAIKSFSNTAFMALQECLGTWASHCRP